MALSGLGQPCVLFLQHRLLTFDPLRHEALAGSGNLKIEALEFQAPKYSQFDR